MLINDKNFIISKDDWVLDKKSELYLPFWREQKQYCIEGITIGGVHMPGRLYFYVNFGTIEMDSEDGTHKVIGTPYLRDIDWEICETIERAELEGKGVILLTARGAGKSFTAASAVAHTYTFYKNSECVVSSEDSPHIRGMMSKVDLCLNNLPFPFYKHRITDNLDRAIWAGYKDRKTGQRKGSNSRILVRNYHNDPMAANGTRPKFHVIEEIGTMKNLKLDYNSSLHCWRNKKGQFSIPFLIGTGGDMDSGRDAAEMFHEPEAYNLISITDIWETNKQIGFFIPATKANNKFKHPKPLTEYLGIDSKESGLVSTTILVSDEEEARIELEATREAKKKASDPLTLLQEIMYNPFVPSEVLLKSGGNRFNRDQIKEHIHFLETRYPDLGIPVDLYINSFSGKVESKGSDKKPIKNFPLRPDDSRAGCVVLYEPPVDNPPYGLYIAGADPYDHNRALNSASLGSCFIYKRLGWMNKDSVTDKDQKLGARQIVAEYTGRPETASEFYENCRLLLLYYNARAMVENENTGIFSHFYNKKYDYLLAETPSLIRNILPDSTVERGKGVHAVGKIQSFGLTLIKQYLEEEIVKEFDEEGRLSKVTLGISRIKSIPLLKELMAFDEEDAKGNYDRVVAFYMALLYEEETQSYMETQLIEHSDPVAFFANTKGVFRRRRKQEVW